MNANCDMCDIKLIISFPFGKPKNGNNRSYYCWECAKTIPGIAAKVDQSVSVKEKY